MRIFERIALLGAGAKINIFWSLFFEKKSRRFPDVKNEMETLKYCLEIYMELSSYANIDFARCSVLVYKGKNVVDLEFFRLTYMRFGNCVQAFLNGKN